MKVALFVSKGYDSKKEIKLSNLMLHYTPIGLLSIAAVLRESGHDVKIFDAGINYKYTNKTWVKKISNFNPDYIGFSTLSFNFDDSYDVCTMIKSKMPNIKTVFGGVHVSLHKQIILEKHPNIDYLIVGDGEYAFRDLVKGIEPIKIPGVFYIDSKTIVGREQTEKDLCNLDDLPFPAYDMLENFPKNNRPELFTYTSKLATNMVTSRGCPFKCSFCYNNTVNKKIRYNSAKYIVDMIEWLCNDYSITHFEFFDDMFTLDKYRIIEFCNEIKKRNLKITFNCFLRNNFERPLILRLKEAGLYVAYIGIESFDQGILNFHKSNIKVKNIKSDLMFLYENNIWCIGLFIIGLPGETEKSLETTIKTIKEMPIKVSSIFPFMPYFGTPIFDDLPNHGKFIEDIHNWRNFNMENFIYLPKGISSKETLVKGLKQMRSAHFKSPYYKGIFSKTIKNDLSSYLRIIKFSPYLLKSLIKNMFRNN